MLAVDTLAASGGQGLLVWHAVQRARAGASIVEVRDWLEENKLHLAHWFTVDDLMFLFRGGRVSKTAAWAGTMLNIKPVMHVDDEKGASSPWRRCAAARSRCTPWWTTWRRRPSPPSTSRWCSSPTATASRTPSTWPDQVKQRFGVPEVVIDYVDPVIGAHSVSRHHGPVLPGRQAVAWRPTA